LSRRPAGELLEAAGKVELVAEAEALRDLPVGEVAALHQGAGTVNRAGAPVLRGWHAGGPREPLSEPVVGHTELAGQIVQIELPLDIGVEQGAGAVDPGGLISREFYLLREQGVTQDELKAADLLQRRRMSGLAGSAEDRLQAVGPVLDRFQMEDWLARTEKTRRAPEIEDRSVMR